MKKINLHQYFFREYFNLGLHDFDYIFEKSPKGDKKLVLSKNAKLTSGVFSDIVPNTVPVEYQPFIIPNDSDNDSQAFQLKISYPGLVTGVGINHEAKIEGEFKLGVHFDYTYGMPVVYGSSVKGVLRSAFILKQEHGKILEYEPYFLEKLTGEQWNQKKIEVLFNDIFEGKDANGPKSIYKRDIFFDAVLVKADQKGRILCSDSITPHGGPERNNPLKNPTPITFLKIAPGCEMEFRFKLVNSVIDGKPFSASQKKALFEEILKTVGVGAKTNVGYGQFQ